MYATVDEVRSMLKDHVIETFMSNDFFDQDPEGKEQSIVQVVQHAIADADAEIDGYLNKRYPTPLRSVPEIINKISKDIAIYNLASRSGMTVQERENNYYVRYKNAIRYLEQVAKGVVEIGSSLIGDGSQDFASSIGYGDFRIKSSPKIFGRKNMGGF